MLLALLPVANQLHKWKIKEQQQKLNNQTESNLQDVFSLPVIISGPAAEIVLSVSLWSH